MTHDNRDIYSVSGDEMSQSFARGGDWEDVVNKAFPVAIPKVK